MPNKSSKWPVDEVILLKRFFGVGRPFETRVLISLLIAVALAWMFFISQKGKEANLTNVHAKSFFSEIHPLVGYTDLSAFMGKMETPSDLTIGKLYDPRLIPALYLHNLRSRLETEASAFIGVTENGIILNTSVAFLWGTFLGISLSRNFIEYDFGKCSQLLTKNGLDLALPCEAINQEDNVIDGKITGPIDLPLEQDLRRYIGQNFMFHNREIPPKIVLLGTFLSDEIHALAFSTLNQPLLHGVVDLQSFVEEYIQLNNGDANISVKFQLESLRSSFQNKQQAWNLSSIDLQSTSLKKAFKTQIALHPENFGTGPGSSKQNQDLTSENTSNITHSRPNKYFHEARLLNTHVGSHYDWRFFKNSAYSNYERKTILHRLAKAWLRFSNSQNLEAWLAHGTLLGWYWNGMNLPWDEDIDVQMSYDSLEDLAQIHNQSLVIDLTDDPNVAGVHLYFIDVSPHYKDRTHGNGDNVVDARFIDTETGMYVDITGLAISNEVHIVDEREFPRKASRLFQVLDADYPNCVKSAELFSSYTGQMQIGQKIRTEATKAWENGELYNCKDGHFYTLSDITPLVKTSFEGEVAFVPNGFKSILEREYPKGLTSKVYGDWLFRPYFGVWTSLGKCGRDYYGDECDDEDIILEEEYTRPYRLKRGHWDSAVTQVPRADPFMIKRNQRLLNVDF